MLILAAAAVLGGVILVALGRGGEMAAFPADHAPLALGEISAADVALLQPPRSIWGYDTQATGEALQAIAQAVTERDVEIGRLRAQLAQLPCAGPAGAGEQAAAAPGAAPAPVTPAPGGAGEQAAGGPGGGNGQAPAAAPGGAGEQAAPAEERRGDG